MSSEDRRKTPHDPPCASSSGSASGRDAVLDFVRTPFAVRRNVVKVWRALPADLWIALSEPEDCTRSRRIERWCLVGVVVMAVMLVVLSSSIGLRTTVGDEDLCFPLLGWSRPAPAGSAPGSGWYYAPGQSLSLALWVVVPSLTGWVFVRSLWIPLVAAGKPTREATLATGRHLAAVYLYVYVMIIVGAALMVPLVLLAPKGLEVFRWCLWCFLFGESFFVSAVMWLRLIIQDSPGAVFGRYRYGILALYMLLFVVIPIWGMLQEF